MVYELENRLYVTCSMSVELARDVEVFSIIKEMMDGAKREVNGAKCG